MTFSPVMVRCRCGRVYARINSRDDLGCPDCVNKPKPKRREKAA